MNHAPGTLGAYESEAGPYSVGPVGDSPRPAPAVPREECSTLRPATPHDRRSRSSTRRTHSRLRFESKTDGGDRRRRQPREGSQREVSRGARPACGERDACADHRRLPCEPRQRSPVRRNEVGVESFRATFGTSGSPADIAPTPVEEGIPSQSRDWRTLSMRDLSLGSEGGASGPPTTASTTSLPAIGRS